MASQEIPTRSRNEYKQLAHVGRGVFGDVFLYEHVATGERVCMKEIDMTFHSPHERARCLNEVELLQHLPQHPHIVGFREAFWFLSDEAGAQILVLILEYADGGDLEEYLRSPSGSPLQEDEARRIFKQLAQAVNHLHSHRVVHRDLKCGNVFLFRSGRVVLGDFGTSKLLPPGAGTGAEQELEAQGLTSTVVGSPLYMSPELLEGDPYGFATDIWSLGCVLYELFSGGKPAFAAPSYPGVVYRITQGQYDLLDSAVVSPEVHNLIASMLRKAPQERPTIGKILQSPWLQREAIMVEPMPMNSGVNADRPEAATSAVQQNEIPTIVAVEDLTVSIALPTPVDRVHMNKRVSTSDQAMPPPAPVHRAVKSPLRQRDTHLQGRAASPLILVTASSIRVVWVI
ncbi:hypothetical protein PRIC1_006187 [Phytophthora ramorum]